MVNSCSELLSSQEQEQVYCTLISVLLSVCCLSVFNYFGQRTMDLSAPVPLDDKHNDKLETKTHIRCFFFVKLLGACQYV